MRPCVNRERNEEFMLRLHGTLLRLTGREDLADVISAGVGITTQVGEEISSDNLHFVDDLFLIERKCGGT